MRLTLPVLLVGLTTGACVATDTTATTDNTASTASGININPSTDGTENAWVNGVQCQMVFPGALTPQTEVYAIWAVGTKGIVYEGNDPTKYNTSEHPNVYAVFGTGATGSELHHVNGYDAYDHYHVVENNHGTEVDNTKWDMLVLVPGPNFNPATYTSAHSVSELLAQSAAGVLSPVSTPAIFGLPGLVLYSPVVCPDQD